MKKTIYYLLSLLALIVQACSSSDNNSNQDNSLLYRKWYAVSSTMDGTTYYPPVCVNNGHRDHLDILTSNVANFYYVDNSNGMNCSDNYAVESFTFTRNGNTLNMTFGNGYTSTITISELTVTTLKFVETNSEGSSYRVYSSF
jgi:hypothetical protein